MGGDASHVLDFRCVSSTDPEGSVLNLFGVCVCVFFPAVYT